MNWSEYSRFVGDIFGAPLALEALMAFFLESTFMGVWIFGWDRLHKCVHALVATFVALGTNLSAFWILVANSFMQHPVGFVLRNGRAEMENFLTIVQNGYVPGQFFHIVLNGLLTAGVIIMAISAWHLLRNNATEFYRRSAKWGMVIALVFGTLGALAGHHQGQYITKVQPMKMAAMEALWETQDPAPFSLVANIDTKAQKNTGALEIPGGLSFLTQNSFTSGKVEGIGERIEGAVDLVIEADDYVASIQPDKTIETRYEQGVMVSMVDKDGKLIPEQGGSRSTSPAPVVIRKGLDIDKIMMHLSDTFNSWDYRQGEYY